MKSKTDGYTGDFFAGGCLWGVQEFIRYLLGVVRTEAGRASGAPSTTASNHNGYAECVRDDSDRIAVEVAPLSNHVKSDPEHQDRLTLNPGD